MLLTHDVLTQYYDCDAYNQLINANYKHFTVFCKNVYKATGYDFDNADFNELDDQVILFLLARYYFIVGIE
jgi:hypothetical protein